MSDGPDWRVLLGAFGVGSLIDGDIDAAQAHPALPRLLPLPGRLIPIVVRL